MVLQCRPGTGSQTRIQFQKMHDKASKRGT
jgi:hypothetical protein